MIKMLVRKDPQRTCRLCGLTGPASEFYLDPKYNFTFCNNLKECWVRWDEKNGMTAWQARRCGL